MPSCVRLLFKSGDIGGLYGIWLFRARPVFIYTFIDISVERKAITVS